MRTPLPPDLKLTPCYGGRIQTLEGTFVRRGAATLPTYAIMYSTLFGASQGGGSILAVLPYVYMTKDLSGVIITFFGALKLAAFDDHIEKRFHAI